VVFNDASAYIALGFGSKNIQQLSGLKLYLLRPCKHTFVRFVVQRARGIEEKGGKAAMATPVVLL
jgi:hypothetical protein